MSLAFNTTEILEMAVKIEKNGQKFYKKAASIVDNADAKQFLLDLVEMELKHEQTFSTMQAELKNADKENVTFDPNNEAGLYLQAMADGHVFDPNEDPEKSLTGKVSLADIFKTAIQAEKDSIIFYIALQDLVQTDSEKNKIQLIINEEKSHIAMLNKHRKLYT